MWSKNSKKYSDKFDKKKIVFNLKEDVVDTRDYPIIDTVKIVKIPDKVDLSKWGTVKNQLSLGACSGFGFAGAYEIMHNLMVNKENDWDASELFIYYNERVLMNTVDSDSGAYLRDGCKAMQDQGASMERFCPYEISKFKNKPSWLAYATGRFSRIKSYHRCYTVEEIKIALANNLPVVFGMKIYSNYLSYKSDVYSQTSGNMLGAHCQVITGYNEELKAFKAKNSWGTGWGENGYSYLSYDMLAWLLTDAWVIIPYGWKGWQK